MKENHKDKGINFKRQMLSNFQWIINECMVRAFDPNYEKFQAKAYLANE